MKSDNEKYAEIITKEYGVELDYSKIPHDANTILDVAWAVLPKEQLILWLTEQAKETERLRRKFNLEPYDKFTAQVEELKLQLNIN